MYERHCPERVEGTLAVTDDVSTEGVTGEREWATATLLTKKPPLRGEMSNELRLAQDDIR